MLPSPTELRGHHYYSVEVMRSILEKAEGDANSFLEKQAEQIRSSGGKVAETHLKAGRSDKEIVRLSEDPDVGTIVIGNRGLGTISRTLMGGVSESVVRHAHCRAASHLPTRITCTSPGPCIPTTSDISMSPERLGPVWKHTLAGSVPPAYL